MLSLRKVVSIHVPQTVMKLHAAKYSDKLSEAIDDGLGVLGQLPRLTIYEELEIGYNMPKTDIPQRFDEFSAILQDTLGPSAETILNFIVERFYDEIKIETRRHTDTIQSTFSIEPSPVKERCSIQSSFPKQH